MRSLMRGSFCKELLLVTVVSTTCMSGSQLNQTQVKSVCLSWRYSLRGMRSKEE